MSSRNSQTLMQTSGDDTFDFLFKIVLIGDCSVGKTKIVQRFKTGNFTESHANTIGVDFSMKTITVDGKKVKTQIWDTAGQERFRTITQSYYRSADGVIIVYDITKRSSFLSIQRWIEEVRRYTTLNVMLILVGNKCDLESLREILFALYEKKIKFTAYEVDVMNGEQYSQWFLELNPKGEVPVLQDGSLIVPESGRIISYIEDHYQGENIPNLLPKDLNRSVLDKVVFFHKKISRIPIGAISMGSFVHTDLCSNPKPPFIGLTRSSFLQNDSKISSVLEQYANVNPIHAENLRKKAQFQEKKRAIYTNREEFMVLVNAVDSVLSEIEAELEKNDLTNNWLCCEQITIADISLAVLLQRLYSLGFEEYFWMQKRPHLRQYFSKISARESFQKSLPTTFSTVRAVWTNTPWMYKAGVAALSATIVISSIIVKT